MFNFVKFIKVYLKLIFFKLGYRIGKITTKEIDLEKLKLINKKNLNKLKDYVDKLVQSYPEDPVLQIERARLGVETHDPNIENFLKACHETKKKWLNDSKFSQLNLEFIHPKIVIGALGNIYHLETLIFANNNNLRLNKTRYLILSKKMNLRNQALFEYFKDYLTIINREDDEKNLSKLSSKLEVPLGMFLDLNHQTLRSEEAANYVEMNKKNSKPLFQLKDHHKEFGLQKLNKIKIPKDAWYVTLHLRETGYRGENLKNTKENHRNVNPMNYISAIKSIISAGGYVFRMGHPGSDKLPKIEGLFDYANSDIKSEVMDVFLAATCKFCIGSTSGYFRIPRYFGVPVLLADGPSHVDYLSLRSEDMYLPRLFRNVKDNRTYKISEAFSYPLNSLFSDDHFKKFNLEVIENTAEDLKEATLEMIDKIVNKNRNFKNEDIQNKFKQTVENVLFTQTKRKITAFADSSLNFLKKNIRLLQ